MSSSRLPKLNRIKRSRWVGLGALVLAELGWAVALFIWPSTWMLWGCSTQILGVMLALFLMLPMLRTGDPRAWVHTSVVLAAVCIASWGWISIVFIGDATAPAYLRLCGFFGAFLWLMVCGFFVRFCVYAHRSRQRMPWRGETGQEVPSAIVVLGAGLVGWWPGPLLVRRIERAVEIGEEYRRRGFTIPIVVSGGQGDDEECSEAEAMERYITTYSCYPCEQILQEDQAVNTRENIHYSLSLLSHYLDKEEKDLYMLLVTSDFHVARTEGTVVHIRQQRQFSAQVLGASTPSAARVAAFLREFVAWGLWIIRRV